MEQIEITRGDEINLELTAPDLNLTGAVFTTRFKAADGTLVELADGVHTRDPDQAQNEGKFVLELSAANTNAMKVGVTKFTTKIVQGSIITQFNGEILVSAGLFDADEVEDTVFPICEIEEKLQVGDKTRINGTKSFVTGGGNILGLTIKPGANSSAQDAFNAPEEGTPTPDNWFLDWAFGSWASDIVDGFNNKIDFEVGDTEYVASVVAGTYTLAQLAAAIETALNLALAGFTVEVDQWDRLVISHASNFILLPAGENRQASLLPHIGWKEDSQSDNESTGTPIEYGFKQITVSANNGGADVTQIKYLKLYSKGGDALFSSDGDLLTWESDIMKWVSEGRSSHLDAHREAQNSIVYWLDKNGYVDINKKKFTKFAFLDDSEVREWSVFKTLAIIMWRISNKKDDVYLSKYYEYVKKYSDARQRMVLRFDIDGNKKIDPNENVDVWSGTVVRR